MTNIDNLIEICESERLKIRALEVPEILELSQDIAYYGAMIDAAHDDPLDDEETQAAILQYFMTQFQELIERYQSLVNDTLP